MTPKLLIVDDSDSIAKTLTEIFEFIGKNDDQHPDYEVGVARDGIEALVKIKKEGYNIVLCDIKMPKMNGIEFTERLKVFRPKIPVIIHSGHNKYYEACTKAGAVAILSKPADLPEMLEVVRKEWLQSLDAHRATT